MAGYGRKYFSTEKLVSGDLSSSDRVLTRPSLYCSHIFGSVFMQRAPKTGPLNHNKHSAHFKNRGVLPAIIS